MWDYSEKVKEHFFTPKNAKAVADANATGNVGSLSCGDALQLTLKVHAETDTIEEAGFQIDGKVEMLLSSDTNTAITKSMGLGLIGFADAYERLAPDMLVVLGDRFEIFAATSAAMIAGIPIAHLHGGETTEGAFDEAIRHSITKMSHLHFVAADEYRRRVIQLGEHPDRVLNVGGMGIDAIKRFKLLSRQELERSLDFALGEKNLLITFLLQPFLFLI